MRPRFVSNSNVCMYAASNYMLSRLADRGQGMNNAVVDASKYVHALTSLNRGESTSLGDVISRYDTEVISRGAKEVEVSQAQTERTHEFDKFVAAATDAMPSSASALE